MQFTWNVRGMITKSQLCYIFLNMFHFDYCQSLTAAYKKPSFLEIGLLLFCHPYSSDFSMTCYGKFVIRCLIPLKDLNGYEYELWISFFLQLRRLILRFLTEVLPFAWIMLTAGAAERLSIKNSWWMAGNRCWMQILHVVLQQGLLNML
jgi:hypothetical protein